MLKNTFLWWFGTIVLAELLGLLFIGGSLLTFVSWVTFIYTPTLALNVGGWILLLIGVILAVIAMYYGYLNRELASQILAIGSGVLLGLMLYTALVINTLSL